ncbi:MAG TPA: hemerythrin domain-containing protein [Candidatus Limnocylindria bacterium]|nr:hemerythrin domain-containing protein [Candidatus Limnocylindria bacterium]
MIHALYRDAFGRAPGLVQRTDPGDAAKVNRVADHLHEILGALRSHHMHEDTLFWDKIEQREPESGEDVARMREQHRDIERRIAGLLDMAEAWRTDPRQKDALAEGLKRLEEKLLLHLDDEERTVRLAASRVLTQEEWSKAGELGRREMPKDRQLVQLGYILHCAPSEELRQGLWHKLPMPVRLAYRAMGRRAFRREWEALYGEKLPK